MRFFVIIMSAVLFSLLIAQRSMGQQVVSKLTSGVQSLQQNSYLKIEKSKEYPDFFQLMECSKDKKTICNPVFVGKYFSSDEIDETVKILDSKFSLVDKTASDFFNFKERVKKTKQPKLLNPSHFTVAQIKDVIRKKVCLSLDSVDKLYKMAYPKQDKTLTVSRLIQRNDCVTLADVGFQQRMENMGEKFKPSRGLAEKTSKPQLPDPRVDLFEYHKQKHQELDRKLNGSEQ